MPVRPMLGSLELHRVQKIEVDGDQYLVQHDVPALEGDFLQRMERGAARVRLVGVLLGSEEVGEGLKQLRDAFYAAQPVTFVADIATATRLDEVVIEEMGVRELAGKPFHFEYAFTLVEFTELDPPGEEPIEPEEPEEPDPETAKLIVEVVVEGVSDYDYSNVIVRVEGSARDEGTINETLGNDLRTGSTWEKDPFPTGSYTVTASTETPQAMTQSESVEVPESGTARVRIVLRPGLSRVAKVFIIHFWFDKAFIEPCLRPVLKEIAAYAQAHSDEKMLILGHTDLAGSAEYNDYLADRRARSVYAYLTYGRDRANALAEWQRLRQRRTPGTRASLNDTWAVREYQHMLQFLGYYQGSIDEDPGPMTRQAIRDFKTAEGITPVDHTMTDETWDRLIATYLDVEPQSVAAGSFFANCCDGDANCGEILKWQGCGEHDPRENTTAAERRNRRTEVIFVKAERLPRRMAAPASFDLPDPVPVNPQWCLTDDNVTDDTTTHTPGRCCVVVPNRVITGSASDDPCPPNGEEDRWRREYASNDLNVTGSVTYSDGTVPTPPPQIVLIAPNGHYVFGEDASGRPIRHQVNADGSFASPATTPAGWYALQVPGYVVQVDGEPLDDVRGDWACKQITASTDAFDVIVVAVDDAAVQPMILTEGEATP